MSLSQTTLIKLQRLGRTMRHELAVPVQLGERFGVATLLRRAGRERYNEQVARQLADFLRSLSESDRKYLARCHRELEVENTRLLAKGLHPYPRFAIDHRVAQSSSEHSDR